MDHLELICSREIEWKYVEGTRRQKLRPYTIITMSSFERYTN